jgi:EmrB/QacA subfamily drug resistance transporter
MSLLSQPAGGRRSALRRGDASSQLVLAIVCAGVVLASLDLFIVNVALPAIARDLGTRDLASLSWVLNAYAIVYAALLVLFGRLAESRRRDSGFLLGVLVFTLASAACGAAPSLPALIGFRIIQAAGAALLTPTSLGLVLATSEPERRPTAVRTWTALGGLAAALGPVVGGLLVAASWRWVFLVNVPIGLGALAIGVRRLPAVPGHAVRRPNPVAAALITVGVGALTLGLVEGNSWGWTSAPTLVALIGSATAVALFVEHCRRDAHPLVDPGLFRARAFSGSSVVSLVFSIAFGAMLLSVVLWDQDVWHWSALQTGLAVAPGPLMVPLFSFQVASRVIPRFGPGRIIAVGSAIYAAGALWWSLRVGITPNYAGEMLPGMLCTGIGVGLTLPTFMSAGAASLPAAAFSTGSAVINMLRQLGLAVGVAILVAVLGTPADPVAALAAFRDGWHVIAAAALLSALAGAVLLRRPDRARESARSSPATASLSGEPGRR